MPILEIAQRLNTLHQRSDAQTILRHTVDDVRLGQTALVSSFGADSIVLLHMLSKIDRSVPVIFVDTLMLFRETLQYQKDVAARLQLTDVRIVSPSTSVLISKDVDCLLHQSKPDVCCSIRISIPHISTVFTTKRRFVRNGFGFSYHLFHTTSSLCI